MPIHYATSIKVQVRSRGLSAFYTEGSLADTANVMREIQAVVTLRTFPEGKVIAALPTKGRDNEAIVDELIPGKHYFSIEAESYTQRGGSVPFKLERPHDKDFDMVTICETLFRSQSVPSDFFALKLVDANRKPLPGISVHVMAHAIDSFGIEGGFGASSVSLRSREDGMLCIWHCSTGVDIYDVVKMQIEEGYEIYLSDYDYFFKPNDYSGTIELILHDSQK